MGLEQEANDWRRKIRGEMMIGEYSMITEMIIFFDNYNFNI